VISLLLCCTFAAAQLDGLLDSLGNVINEGDVLDTYHNWRLEYHYDGGKHILLFVKDRVTTGHRKCYVIEADARWEEFVKNPDAVETITEEIYAMVMNASLTETHITTNDIATNYGHADAAMECRGHDSYLINYIPSFAQLGDLVDSLGNLIAEGDVLDTIHNWRLEYHYDGGKHILLFVKDRVTTGHRACYVIEANPSWQEFVKNPDAVITITEEIYGLVMNANTTVSHITTNDITTNYGHADAAMECRGHDSYLLNYTPSIASNFTTTPLPSTAAP